ncbi:hypothetical protein ACF3DV_11595 [Chlorogloeopsis fritschii PCC 9212]|uniref:Uncharacterized protein n=1 Tax=Chlorogloeopsis fritschii PCC 6912 TaxID=211165 RepID=A0A3S0XSF1_CHLFR|nr:hypothetical protein [Chlorogloeopsis fritschii]RUR76551.1 hypothetical protein PCC6912_43390 [Chlorogloeopsis fritschii PCC 6912]
MDLQELQTKAAANNDFIVDKTNPTNSKGFEPMSLVQRVNLIISKELPDLRFLSVISVSVASLLFVAAIYYGIINP